MTKKVIIADDSALARAFMIKCIKVSGVSDCIFIEVSNGLEAIEKLKEVIPDLLITDINMPKLNGIDLVKTIKANPKLVDIPIVVMTSAGNSEQRDELERLNVSQILAKPFTPKDVMDIANNLLGNGNNKDAKEEEW